MGVRAESAELQAFNIMCLRRVDGVRRMDRVRNEVLRKALRQGAVLNIYREEEAKEEEGKLEQMAWVKKDWVETIHRRNKEMETKETTSVGKMCKKYV